MKRNDVLSRVLTHFLTERYGYNHYPSSNNHIYDLLQLGYLKGRSITDDGTGIYGFFIVTSLGKSWLEFNKL